MPLFVEEMEGDELWIGGENGEENLAVSVEDQKQEIKLIGNGPNESNRVAEVVQKNQIKKGNLSKSVKLPKTPKV